MSKPHTKPIQIEIAGEPVGVVVPSNGRFRFIAVKLNAFPLDGRLFDSIGDARAALHAAFAGTQEVA